MKVKFLQNRTVKDGSGDSFKKGQVVEMSERSAYHWISRGVAVEYVEPVEPVKTETKKESVTRAFRTRNRSN